ncbi:MAG TPA: hypothetical protein PLO63_02490 [Syntrophales bacterium]|nr:hypothetical protein [Syntrophales bacterium]
MKKILSTICLSCLVVIFLFPADLIAQSAGTGEINWVQGYISVTGQGAAVRGSLAQARPLARRAAVSDAQRNLLEIIKGVKIDSTTTVENFIVASDVIRSHVNGVVKGAHVVKGSEKYEPQPDGSVLVTLEMRVCITGNCGASRSSLVQALGIDRIKPPAYVPPPAPPLPIPAPPAAAPPAPPASAPPPKPAYTCDLTKSVTGLVINLEGLPFERVLLPVIVVEEGQTGLFTVYSAKNVKPAVVRTFGVVRYADSVDHALKGNPQIGTNVLVVPASSITKENMIVIKSNDRRVIFETTCHGNDYLADAKVVIANQ